MEWLMDSTTRETDPGAMQVPSITAAPNVCIALGYSSNRSIMHIAEHQHATAAGLQLLQVCYLAKHRTEEMLILVHGDAKSCTHVHRQQKYARALCTLELLAYVACFVLHYSWHNFRKICLQETP